jgi:tyrosyl-tRNA synthetase
MLRRFSRVLGELESRNLLHQTSDRIALEKHLEKSRVVYTGFDPTAKSLHVGNLLTIVALLHFQIHGHRPIALIGGATGSIGDPSGKSTERNAIDPAIMKQNTDAITCQLKTVFRNAELYAERQGHDITTKVQLENNLDWFKDIKLIDFLKFGRYFRVNSMMAKDSVKSRLQDQNGISFAEFSYQILQAYDFWKLFESKECTIQV